MDACRFVIADLRVADLHSLSLCCVCCGVHWSWVYRSSGMELPMVVVCTLLLMSTICGYLCKNWFGCIPFCRASHELKRLVQVLLAFSFVSARCGSPVCT